MVKVEKSRVICAGVDRVWEILADPESDRKLFKNIRDIKVTSAIGNIIERGDDGPKRLPSEDQADAHANTKVIHEAVHRG